MAKQEHENVHDLAYGLMRQLEALTLTSRHLLEAAEADQQRAEAIERCRENVLERSSLAELDDDLDAWFARLPDAPTARILRQLFQELRLEQSQEKAWLGVSKRAVELMQKAQAKAIRTKADAESAETHRLEIVEQLKGMETTKASEGSPT